jgi:hypothetical protein
MTIEIGRQFIFAKSSIIKFIYVYGQNYAFYVTSTAHEFTLLFSTTSAMA